MCLNTPSATRPLKALHLLRYIVARLLPRTGYSTPHALTPRASHLKRFERSMPYILAAVLSFYSTGCTKNYIAQFATTNDQSYLYQALIDINSGNYTSAITDCSNISAASLTDEQFATVCASAYAGRCGFTMSNMETDIKGYSTATPPYVTPWALYMIGVLGSTPTSAISDCDTAESILRGIGPASSRSSDANFYMMTLTLYKIAVIAKALGDPTNTGALSAGFDACTIATSPTNYQQMMAEAVWDLSQAASQLTSDAFVGTFAQAIVTMTSPTLNLCSTIASVNDSGGKAENICSPTSVSAITTDQIKGALSILKEGSEMGVNQGGATGCNNGNVTVAACQCL